MVAQNSVSEIIIFSHFSIYLGVRKERTIREKISEIQILLKADIYRWCIY